MSLWDDSINDAAAYTGDAGEWATPITIVDNSGHTVVVNGLQMKHHMAVDTDGVPVSSKTAGITVSEKNIIAENPLFVIRNSNKEVAMKGYKVFLKDSTGQTCSYKINTQFPDETLGLLVFTLTDYLDA